MKRFVFLLAFFLTIPITVSAVDSKNIYKHVETDTKSIALTFDDGPHPQKTSDVLEVLKKHDVNATFFLIGLNAERYPEIVRQIINEGHEIGNHTYSHDLKSKKASAKDVERLDNYIEESFEYKIKLFRPPGGIIKEDTERISQTFGYKIILWDIDTKDWAHKNVVSIKDNIIKNAKPGSIVLMHDYITGTGNTAEALDTVIPLLKKAGYSFQTVSDLLSKKG